MRLDEAKQILNENGFMLKERFVNIDEIRVRMVMGSIRNG